MMLYSKQRRCNIDYSHNVHYHSFFYLFLLSIIETHLYFTTEISGPDISHRYMCALFYKQVLYTTWLFLIFVLHIIIFALYLFCYLLIYRKY